MSSLPTTTPSQPDSTPLDIQSQIDDLLISDTSTLDLLITATHILAHHKILDGFGHLTARSPTNPSLFYYTGIPAALITSPKAYTIFHVSTDVPFNPSTKTSPYSEHFIHAGFYATYHDVHAVIHSHAPETLPFSLLCNPAPSQRLRAVMHTAAAIGSGVPTWDIDDAYTELADADHPRNLLVNSLPLGLHLARSARVPSGTADVMDSHTQAKHHQLVLQRGHGFTACAGKIEEVVFNAYYAVQNAIVLREALSLIKSGGGEIRALSEEEVEACTVMDYESLGKVWPLWVAEVERNGFYRRE